MFGQVHSPQSLLPEELDRYLDKGWFRMGQTIFTTHFLNFKNNFYSALWLRIDLNEYTGDRTQHKLFQQNKRFRTEVRPSLITEESENLFREYKTGITFEASPSLHHLLYGKADASVFNTMEVLVYDGVKLIACGIFDLGLKTAAGITSFYDPSYKKFSLGKYLIYQKINYCKEKGLEYFYPGYFVPGYSFFDYKLQIGKHALQFYRLDTDDWRSINDFAPDLIPIQNMYDNLVMMKTLLAQSSIPSRIYKYDFFEINLMQELGEMGLFDFPLFLQLDSNHTDGLEPVIVFDVVSHQFQLLKCRSVWMPGYMSSTEENYSQHVLKTDYEIYASSSTVEMSAVIRAIRQ